MTEKLQTRCGPAKRIFRDAGADNPDINAVCALLEQYGGENRALLGRIGPCNVFFSTISAKNQK
jgi:hypothetical protein